MRRVRTRGAAALVAAGALALALGAGGCAAGRFIAGAPRPGTTSTGEAAGRTARASSGQALLSRRCTGCHARPEPARLSSKDWQGALKRMQIRIKLPQAEWDSLAVLPTQTAVAPGGVAR